MIVKSQNYLILLAPEKILLECCVDMVGPNHATFLGKEIILIYMSNQIVLMET